MWAFNFFDATGDHKYSDGTVQEDNGTNYRILKTGCLSLQFNTWK